jgi:hypothetical protein
MYSVSRTAGAAAHFSKPSVHFTVFTFTPSYLVAALFAPLASACSCSHIHEATNGDSHTGMCPFFPILFSASQRPVTGPLDRGPLSSQHLPCLPHVVPPKASQMAPTSFTAVSHPRPTDIGTLDLSQVDVSFMVLPSFVLGSFPTTPPPPPPLPLIAGVSESNSGLVAYSCHVHFFPPQTKHVFPFPSPFRFLIFYQGGCRSLASEAILRPKKLPRPSLYTTIIFNRSHPHPHTDARRTYLLFLPSPPPTCAAQPLPV